MTPFFITVICWTLISFLTNNRDRNINIAIKNRYKNTIINIKGNNAYYLQHGRANQLFHSLLVLLHLFSHSLSPSIK